MTAGPHKILFICLGNICRSPAAEGVMRLLQPDFDVDSAGTGDWHVGDPPYAPMIRAARRRGIDLANLRARQVNAEDFDRFDLFVVMDRENQLRTEALRPAGNATPVVLLAAYADHDAQEVPDPYYTRDFDGALDLVTSGCRGLVHALNSADGDQARLP